MQSRNGYHKGTGVPVGYERQNVMFTLSEKFLSLLDQHCYTHDVSRSLVIRQAIAAHIGYDLDAEPQPDRRRKYDSPVQRKAAQAARDKIKRQLVKKIQESFQDGDTEAVLESVKQSLK